MNHMNHQMQESIQNCQECHRGCLHQAMQHCLEMGGPHVEANKGK